MTATLVALLLVGFIPAFPQQDARKTFVLSGRVVDGTTGKPLSDTAVVIWPRLAERAAGRRVPAPNGVFTIPDLTPGLYVIAAEVPGGRFSYRTETVAVDLRNGDVTGLGLVITPVGPRPALVRGKIVMDGGGTLPASLTRIRIGSTTTDLEPGGSFQVQMRAEEQYSLKLENLPEGTSIGSLSSGTWNGANETLVFSSTPPDTLQITLTVGTRALRGRVLDKARLPVNAPAVVTVMGISPAMPVRTAEVKPDGTFELTRLRSGDYEITARSGSGTATQFARIPLTIGSADRGGIEVVLKGVTPQTGRVVIEGAGRVEDLLRFRPMIEVRDILGVHRVPLDANGTFAFESFEGEYAVAIRDVPPGYTTSIAVAGSSVEVRLRVVQGDDFGPALRVPPRILK